MKIQRFLSGAIATDGGTIACAVLLEDGSELDIGLDCRIPKRKHERLLFVGAGYPTEPNARILPRGSQEEAELIAAIAEYIEQIGASAKLTGKQFPQRDGDKMALMLLDAIVNREG